MEEVVILTLESQTWVKARTKIHGLITIESYAPMYRKTQCYVLTGAHQSEQGKPFSVFVANFSPKFVKLSKDQMITITDEHLSEVTDADISHTEMLGIADASVVQKHFFVFLRLSLVTSAVEGNLPLVSDMVK